jgi:hypothetical protein
MQTTDNKRLATLTLAALGIVYGDIGTSPLYAIKEVFGSAHHPVPITPDNVLGVLSLFLWSLLIVVTLKYVSFIMRANNKGEGGVIALLTLALHNGDPASRRQRLLIALGLFGAALFYGDGVITPAISVLSAVEGLEIITPAFNPYILPITLGILIGLFFFQRRGTASVGALFGPIMVLWFAVLAAFGALAIVEHPAVLAAVNPVYGFHFLIGNSTLGFFALGAVVLCITGAEALYADMGHFGARPIRYAWLGYVLPALLINYFGQGALLLADPTSVENPFYLLAPDWARYPLVILATVATIIASQAVISGAFSITQQAIQLGYTPRLEIQHTSDRHQLAAADRHHRPGRRLRQFVQPGRRLRHRSHRHDADHQPARHRRRRPPLVVEPVARRARRPALHRHRPRLLSRQFGQDSRWRLVPARLRARCLHPADDLEARPRTAAQAAGRRRAATQALHRRHRRQRHRTGTRHRHLPDAKPGRRSARPAAQPQALQDAA